MGLGFNFVMYKDAAALRQNMLENAVTTAITVAAYAVSDLVFNDKQAGRDTLSGLKSVPSTLNAFLYDGQGILFASLHEIERPPVITEMGKDIARYQGNQLHVIKPIQHQSRELGSIYIQFSTQQLDEQMQQYRIFLVFTAIGLLFISYLLANFLSRLVSKPILNLSQVANEFSRDINYKIRVNNKTRDEVGDLYDAFNEMLARIQQDNIKRKKSEQALAESKDRLKQFFQAAYEGIFFHEQGKILDINPGITTIAGYSPVEVIGHNLLEFIEPSIRQQVAKTIEDKVNTTFETQITHKNGHAIPVEVRARTMEVDNHDIRVVGIVDITERREAQKKLQQAYDILEEKVEERTADLQAANIKLKELDQLKSMFIASISHELRTPLNSIIGFSSMMMRGVYGDLGKKYSDYISRINNSGIHLLSLITDIIDISKIESGRIDVEISEFDIGDLISEALESIRKQAEDKNLSLHVNAFPETILHTDRRRLLQCMLNFLSNAIKYSEQGTITLTLEVSKDDIIFYVEDTGIGINKKDIPRLFEPFERIDTHLQVKAGGTGLGLYLTKKIATELLQGEIGVESRSGEGSKFWIQTPKNLNIHQKTTII